jgi:hypothetical protein
VTGFRGSSCAVPDLDPVRSALTSALEASGLTVSERARYEERFDALAVDVAARVGAIHSPERRARRLHRILHARVFAHYRGDADGVPDVLDQGEFNCVSSTLVEGLLARSLGLQPVIVPGSRHVFLRIELRSRAIDVETTAPDGFDARGDTGAATRILLAYKLATPEEIARRGEREIVDRYEHVGPAVPLEDGAAFVWHNAAERALARGDGSGAVRRILAGETRFPGVAASHETLQAELGRAFRLDYDEGRFDDAFATAAIGVGLDPALVSAQDRLIAAAAQRVERLVDDGSVEQAESVLVDLRNVLGNGAARFERHVLPVIVAAAVRVGDWERASRLADRYAGVELDDHVVQAGLGAQQRRGVLVDRRVLAPDLHRHEIRSAPAPAPAPTRPGITSRPRSRTGPPAFRPSRQSSA